MVQQLLSDADLDTIMQWRVMQRFMDELSETEDDNDQRKSEREAARSKMLEAARFKILEAGRLGPEHYAHLQTVS